MQNPNISNNGNQRPTTIKQTTTLKFINQGTNIRLQRKVNNFDEVNCNSAQPKKEKYRKPEIC